MNKIRGRTGFGRRLEVAIVASGSSKSGLAARIGKSSQQISNWLSRDTAPSEAAVRLLAEALGVQEAWLHYGNEAGDDDRDFAYQVRSGLAGEIKEGGERHYPDDGTAEDLWADLPSTSYLKPKAQSTYDAHLGSYMRRRWHREEVIEAARTLVRPIEGSNTMWMNGRGKELSEDEQIMVIEEMASIVESLMRAKGSGRSR